ncbi:T6SS effector BTH_I2691 family protein [Acinetobacter bereziniae]|uniref:T6SS effector BTH_I2691 family protein n=1 Tax=Acinetobacter bereziniae TaxID=106648 RepID=UPI003466E56A
MPDHLNYKEIEAFKQEVAQKYDTALKVANQRAQEHLNWVVSESLLDALDAYDQKDLQSGCAFKAHVTTMLFGMEGAEAGARQLDDWVKKPDYERKNLFIRGLYSNQLEAKAKHEELKKAATDLTAVGIKAMKGTIDFLMKTDSAWDEWARNQGIDKNKGNIAFSKVEKKVMLYVSNFARVVFRAGMGSTAESRFVAAISQKLLFAQMGELAGKLRFDQVVHNINPEKLNSGNIKLSPELGERVGGQLSKNTKEATMRSLDVLIDDAMAKKQQVALTLEEIEKAGSKGMVNHTNNYHQVRASGILVFLEAINLTHMLSTGKYKDNVQIAALVASVSALMAFALDIFYGLAKGVREVATQTSYGGAGAAATRGAANIQRAGIKWAAGSLSAFAGGITAWLDYKKFENLNEKEGIPRSLMIMYSARTVTGVLSAGFGILAALTYIAPLMNYLKKIGKSPVIQRLGGRLIATKLTEEAARIALLRGVAWASGVGLILTVIEVTFFIYMEATKLRRWCEYSTFRTLKTNQLMSEKQEEEDFQTLFAQ